MFHQKMLPQNVDYLFTFFDWLHSNGDMLSVTDNELHISIAGMIVHGVQTTDSRAYQLFTPNSFIM